jgi:hemerythrin-like metal-binding protein
MPPFSWDTKFSVGHAMVDRQHKELLNIMNEMESLLVASPGNYDRIIRLDIVTRLLDFTAKHFRLEQELMLEGGYLVAEAHGHWRSHKEYDATFYTLYRELRAKELVLDSSILAAIRNKFFNHILLEDKKTFQFLFADPQRQARLEVIGYQEKSPWQLFASPLSLAGQ